jgi:hypothetical protein
MEIVMGTSKNAVHVSLRGAQGKLGSILPCPLCGMDERYLQPNFKAFRSH